MTKTLPLLSGPRALAAAAILFDLDGTLADTADDLAGALNKVRSEHGLAPLPTSALRAHASSGARGLLGAGMGIGPDDDRFRPLRDAATAAAMPAGPPPSTTTSYSPMTGVLRSGSAISRRTFSRVTLRHGRLAGARSMGS